MYAITDTVSRNMTFSSCTLHPTSPSMEFTVTHRLPPSTARLWDLESCVILNIFWLFLLTTTSNRCWRVTHWTTQNFSTLWAPKTLQTWMKHHIAEKGKERCQVWKSHTESNQDTFLMHRYQFFQAETCVYASCWISSSQWNCTYFLGAAYEKVK